MRIGTYEYQYLFLGIFLLIAIVFPLLPIILARFIAPKKPNPIKTSSYECGIEAKGDFNSHNHFGFEAVSWYWHFVDVVWLALFVIVYWL